MVDEHNVLSHALLGNQHFLVAVDDEVTTLVIAALLRALHNFVLTHLGQVAEF